MNDIARLADVSVATVSRVLSNSPNVRDDTRARVLAVVKEHQYEPSYVARSLSTSKTRTVGVVIDDIANPFFMELAKGAEQVVRQQGYTMLLTCSNWDRDVEHDLVRALVRNRVEGVLIAAIDPEADSIRLLRSSGVPFVLMNCWSSDNTVSSVSGDSYAGGELAGNCLLRADVQQYICLFGVPHQSSDERARGFLDAVAAGHPSAPLETYYDVETFDQGYEIVSRLAAVHRIDRVRTGIFASNDFVAMGVVDSLVDHGISVPEQVSVVGFDDIEFAARYRVPLTTVAQPKTTMGELAAGALLDRLEQPNRDGRRLVLKPRLVVRDTCRPSTERSAQLRAPINTTETHEHT